MAIFRVRPLPYAAQRFARLNFGGRFVFIVSDCPVSTCRKPRVCVVDQKAVSRTVLCMAANVYGAATGDVAVFKG